VRKSGTKSLIPVIFRSYIKEKDMWKGRNKNQPDETGRKKKNEECDPVCRGRGVGTFHQKKKELGVENITKLYHRVANFREPYQGGWDLNTDRKVHLGEA